MPCARVPRASTRRSSRQRIFPKPGPSTRWTTRSTRSVLGSTIKWEWKDDLRAVRSMEPTGHLDARLEVLLDDPRLYQPAASINGCETLSVFSDKLNVKRPGGAPFPWHQEGLYWENGAEDLESLVSGILSAIKLQEAGLDNFAIYEKADRLGGTWRENEYAGMACDVPSHLYCYSFAPNPDWSHRFSPGAEIQAYFEDVAHRYGVDKLIQYGKEITRCEFEDGRWKIEMADGSTDVGDFVIAATGVLHHPAYPDIEGLDSFEGTTFHSARWNHDVPLAGKRVGVIGTGSTAIQIVGADRRGGGALALPAHRPMGHAPGEPGLQRGGEGRVPEAPRDHGADPIGDLAPVRRHVLQCRRRRELARARGDP